MAQEKEKRKPSSSSRPRGLLRPRGHRHRDGAARGPFDRACECCGAVYESEHLRKQAELADALMREPLSPTLATIRAGLLEAGPEYLLPCGCCVSGQTFPRLYAWAREQAGTPSSRR